MSQLHYKRSGLEVKDLDTKARTVMGYGSAFGMMDYDGDIIRRGAYAKTIQERGPQGTDQIAMLWQHKYDQPIGKITVLREDENGLYFEAKMSDTQKGRDALTYYEEGIIKEHSVGFKIIDAEMENDAQVIKEIMLYEVSAVTWGANPNTPLVGMKAEEKLEAFKQAQEQMTSIMRTLHKGNISDEMGRQLEYGLMQVEKTYNALAESLAEGETSPNGGEPQEDFDLMKSWNELGGFDENGQPEDVSSLFKDFKL